MKESQSLIHVTVISTANWLIYRGASPIRIDRAEAIIGRAAGTLLEGTLPSFSLPCTLFDTSFVIAICGGLYEFASADFFDDASAKPLPN